MELRLFEFDVDSKNSAQAIRPIDLNLEKDIQAICENNLQEFFDITFLDTEHTTSNIKGGGRIDTLGIDTRGNPVIIEYKLSRSDSVINQALDYLDWLEDHKADFRLIVQEHLDQQQTIKWSSPRIICIAKEFYKYDYSIVKRQGVNIDLIRYQVYENNLISFEYAHQSRVSTKKNARKVTASIPVAPTTNTPKLDRDWFIKGRTYQAQGRFKDPSVISERGGKNARTIKGEFVVLKGSTISRRHRPSFAAHCIAERAEAIERNTKSVGGDITLKRDVTFSSMNQAASFVVSGRVNAWTTIKDKDGRSIKKVLQT